MANGKQDSRGGELGGESHFLLSGSRPGAALGPALTAGGLTGAWGLQPAKRLWSLSAVSLLTLQTRPTPCPPQPLSPTPFIHTHSLTCTLSSSVDVGGQPTPQTWAQAFPLQSTPPSTSSRLSPLLTLIARVASPFGPQRRREEVGCGG